MITNTHPFNKECYIKIDSKYNVTEFSVSGIDLTHPRNIEELLCKIYHVFTMTGVDYDYSGKFEEHLQFNGISLDERESSELKKKLYQMKLEFNVRFIDGTQHFCEMNGCRDSNLINFKKYETYGEIMHLFGIDYPDSVLLKLEHVTTVEDLECSEQKELFRTKFDEEINYIRWYYYR